jgi:hypothetical protein
MAADPGKRVRAYRPKKMLRLLRWSNDSRVQELGAAAGQGWAHGGGGVAAAVVGEEPGLWGERGGVGLALRGGRRKRV